MAAQVQIVQIHTHEQVRQIVKEAWEIALDLAPSPEDVHTTFEKVTDLLSARITLQPMPAQMMPPLDLSNLGFKG